MKREGLRFVLVAVLLLAGCHKDLPKPETKVNVLKVNMAAVMGTRGVEVASASETPSLSVQYAIRGQNVFVECVVSGVSFRESDKAQQTLGKILISVDGRKQQEALAAAFIIKNLTAGTHRVTLEVVDRMNRPIGLLKEFTVVIPSV